MLRSMLAADPRVVDTGSIWSRRDSFRAFLDERRGHPGKVILSNPKWGLRGSGPFEPRARILKAVGARE